MATKRTAAAEKKICLRLARHWLNGESAVVTANSLARLLFEQRDAIRRIGDDTEDSDVGFDELPGE